jgi:hypothetical protein
LLFVELLRRVRWENVGRLTALVAAAVLAAGMARGCGGADPPRPEADPVPDREVQVPRREAPTAPERRRTEAVKGEKGRKRVAGSRGRVVRERPSVPEQTGRVMPERPSVPERPRLPAPVPVPEPPPPSGEFGPEPSRGL